MLEPDELRSRMLDYIAARDRLTRAEAVKAYDRLKIPGDLVMLEMEMAWRNPVRHDFDYDPCA